MRREQLVEAIPVAPACLEARLQNLLRWQGKPFGRIEGEPLRHATGHDIVPHFLRFLDRSEEHTSELQSLMRISYAVFCLKKKKTYIHTTITYSIKQYYIHYNSHQ